MSLKEVKIGQLGKVITGNTPPKKDPDNYGGIYPFIKPTDMEIDRKYVTEWEESYSEKAFNMYHKAYIPPGATGVVTIGTVGDKLFQTHKHCFTNQSVNVIIPNDDYVDDYVYYLMKLNLNKVENANPGTASGRHHVSKSNFCSIKVDVIENIKTQKRIADILSAYDDLIENNLKRIKLLEQAAQNLYKEWFVNMRFPGHENTPINQETGLPEGWTQKELGEIISRLESGSRPKGGIDKTLKVGVPSIGAESIRGLGYFDFSKTKYVNRDFFLKMKKGRLKHKDILIYKDGAYIGRSTLFQDSFPFEECSINEHVFLIHSSNELLQYYLYFTLHSNVYYEKMQNLNSNAAQPGINQTKIKTLLILIPVDDLLIEFDKLISPIVKKIYVLAKENLRLKNARDILLPRLMNQTIEV